MSEQPQPTPPDRARKPGGNANAAFLPIGITFLVLGLGGLANESMRSSAYAFLPVGIVFLVLSLRSSDDDEDEDAEPTAAPAPQDGAPGSEDGPGEGRGPGVPPAGPDVTPR